LIWNRIKSAESGPPVHHNRSLPKNVTVFSYLYFRFEE